MPMTSKETKLYVNKEGSSNKFWSYEIDGLAVTVKWGRVGLEGQKKVFGFKNFSGIDRFINRRVREQLGKGYKEIDRPGLAQEVQIAKTMGAQHKINRIEYVGLRKNKDRGGRLNLLLNYDPSQWIYVEVINSWTKEVSHIVLNKAEEYEAVGLAEEREARRIEFENLGRPRRDFVEGIRLAIRRIAVAVVAALKRFGDLGSRSLDGDVTDVGPRFSDALEEETGASRQVVSKFAGLGARILDI